MEKRKKTNKHLSEKQNWDRMSKIQPKNKENKLLRERERERERERKKKGKGCQKYSNKIRGKTSQWEEEDQ